MSALKGKYYASIFTHYQLVDRDIWDFSIEVITHVTRSIHSYSFTLVSHSAHCIVFRSLQDVIAAVPPHWADRVVEDKGSRWADR